MAVPKPATAKPRADRRGAPKGHSGNPKFKPTDEQRQRVEVMISSGAQHWLVADDLGISVDTLTRHFVKELEHGLHRAMSLIGASIISKALNGDQDAAKFVLARRGGWKSTTAVEQSGPGGGPIAHTIEPPRRDLSNLSAAELEQLEALTAKAEARERAADE